MKTGFTCFTADPIRPLRRQHNKETLSPNVLPVFPQISLFFLLKLFLLTHLGCVPNHDGGVRRPKENTELRPASLPKASVASEVAIATGIRVQVYLKALFINPMSILLRFKSFFGTLVIHVRVLNHRLSQRIRGRVVAKQQTEVAEAEDRGE